jgi:hypothetical protein
MRRDMKRRALFLALALSVVAALFLRVWRPFPPDTTPRGAYMRIARHLSRNEPLSIFPYLETEAQWASYTAFEARRDARKLILETYPEPARAAALATLKDSSASGEAWFVAEAESRSWFTRLRRDLSPPEQVEEVGERAVVVTARGTRYPFRKRENGIWGLTVFTADLVAESTRASRDLAMIRKSAEDYKLHPK